MFMWLGKRSWYATGDIFFVMVKGPRRFCSIFFDGAFVLMFLASSQTSCPVSSVLMGLLICVFRWSAWWALFLALVSSSSRRFTAGTSSLPAVQLACGLHPIIR